MEVIVYRALFLCSVSLTVYGGITYGAPGAVAGLMMGCFLCFGLGGIVVTRGIFGGVGGIFLWFILFCGVSVGMFLFERYGVDGGALPGKKFGHGGDYFADKVVDIVGRWGSLNASPGDYKFFVVFMVIGFILSGLLGGKK